MQMCSALQVRPIVQSALVTHSTQVSVVVSHLRTTAPPPGAPPPPVQLALDRHSTQRIVVVLQYGAAAPPTPPPPPHCASEVQVATHVPVVVSHVVFAPVQLALPTHATHSPAVEQYGVRPPHWASVVHATPATHVCVVVLQVSSPVPTPTQFAVARHWTHWPAVVSQ